VSIARNIGAAAATGNSLLFLDADDTLDPGALKAFEDAGSSMADQVVLYGDVIDAMETGERLPRQPADFEGAGYLSARKIFDQGLIPPGAMLVQQSTARRAGLFASRFSYAADLDFWLRCAALVRFVRVRHPVLTYRVHTANMSRNTHVAMTENIDVLLGFQGWCAERGLHVLERQWTEIELLDRLHCPGAASDQPDRAIDPSPSQASRLGVSSQRCP
jgi:glycosyltransferase involved in cell wall biosynthesis